MQEKNDDLHGMHPKQMSNPNQTCLTSKKETLFIILVRLSCLLLVDPIIQLQNLHSTSVTILLLFTWPHRDLQLERIKAVFASV